MGTTVVPAQPCSCMLRRCRTPGSPRNSRRQYGDIVGDCRGPYFGWPWLSVPSRHFMAADRFQVWGSDLALQLEPLPGKLVG